MAIKIQNQHVGINQTFRGKRIGDMTPVELINFEKFMRSKMDIEQFSYDIEGEGEVYTESNGNTIVNGGINGGVFTPPSNPKSKPKSTCSINIGGKHYNSWDEVMNDTSNPHIINKMTIDGNGNKIVERNNKVYINGELVCDKSQQQVVIVVHGNVEEIDTQMSEVRVYGNVGSVDTQSGSITAETIEGDASTMSGSVHAKTIHGDASTMSGNVYKN